MLVIAGILLLLVSFGVCGFGIWQWRKMSMIGGAPLAQSGQAAGSASEKGLVAVEGSIITPEPLIAPCSGRSCLYYEVVTYQRHQKYVSTGDSSRKVSGKKQIKKDVMGARFYIDDGSGPAKVDATECKVNAKMEKAFEQEGGKHGHLTFGSYQVNVPPHTGEGWGTGSVCIEKIVPAEGSAYVAGRLEGDTIMKKKNVGGRLLIAREGLDKLQGSTKMKMLAGLIGGAFLMISGGAMAAVGVATGAVPGTPDHASIAPGFTPSPMTFNGIAGGSQEASTRRPDCLGNIPSTPDLEFSVSAAIPMLRIMAKSTQDTTLLVQMTDGSYLCNDDSEDVHPAISAAFPPGDYRVWVGTFSGDDRPVYTLGLTEDEKILPSSL